MSFESDLVTVHATYSQRLQQIDNWRHIHVAFTYGFLVPGSGRIILGADYMDSSIEAYLIYLVATLVITTFASLFETWTQKRCLVMARCLHIIENDEKFLPDFKHKGDLYYQNTRKRVPLYLSVTQMGFYLQHLVIAGIGYIIFLKLSFSQENGFINITLLLVGYLFIFCMFWFFKKRILGSEEIKMKNLSGVI